jgi:hypothetical protein
MLVILVSARIFYYQYYVPPETLVSHHIPEHVVIYLVAEQWAFKVNGTIDIRSTPIWFSFHSVDLVHKHSVHNRREKVTFS